MKSHKYWSIGALITMLGTFYTGYNLRSSTVIHDRWPYFFIHLGRKEVKAIGGI